MIPRESCGNELTGHRIRIGRMNQSVILKKWERLPENMQCDEVRPYYEVLARKRGALLAKRLLDFLFALLLFILLFPIMALIGILVKCSSKGTVFFRQVRVTRYGKLFRIFKFRTMVADAEQKGTQVTVQNDARVTRIGAMLRRTRLDELPQLINILKGEMSFVGARPEVVKYVACYTNQMKATLLLPAGITSEASILFRNEARLLSQSQNVEQTYITEILPKKMKYNLDGLLHFSLWHDCVTALRTVAAVFGRTDASIHKSRENSEG